MAKRKFPNGFGGVTKLSGNRRNPFMAYITAGFDSDGHQHKVPLAYKDSYEKAFAFLTDYNEGNYNIDFTNKTTLEIYNLWHKDMEKLVPDQMDEHSLYLYENAFMTHCKVLHNLKFEKVKTKDIQRIIDNMTLGYTSKRYVKGVFSFMFDFAMQNDAPITKNYAEFVRISNSQEVAKEYVRISDDQINILCENVNCIPNADILVFLLYTGLRAKEFINLKISNICLEEKYFIAGCKTEAGKDRTIPIHPKILGIIEKRLLNNTNEYLFVRDNNQYTYDTLRTDFDNVLKQLHINEEYTPHDCRRTFATRMKLVKADKNAVKKIIGHKITDITEGVYTVWSPQMLYEEIAKLN